MSSLLGNIYSTTIVYVTQNCQFTVKEWHWRWQQGKCQMNIQNGLPHSLPSYPPGVGMVVSSVGKYCITYWHVTVMWLHISVTSSERGYHLKLNNDIILSNPVSLRQYIWHFEGWLVCHFTGSLFEGWKLGTSAFRGEEYIPGYMGTCYLGTGAGGVGKLFDSTDVKHSSKKDVCQLCYFVF